MYIKAKHIPPLLKVKHSARLVSALFTAEHMDVTKEIPIVIVSVWNVWITAASMFTYYRLVHISETLSSTLKHYSRAVQNKTHHNTDALLTSCTEQTHHNTDALLTSCTEQTHHNTDALLTSCTEQIHHYWCTVNELYRTNTSLYRCTVNELYRTNTS